MKLIRRLMVLLVALVLVAGVALAQATWPFRPPTQPNNNTTVKGTAHAPTDTDAQIAENRQTIPASAEAHAAPPVLDDAGLAEAAHNTPLGVVRLTRDKGKPTLGFLLPGADKEHWFVVTNFFPIAGAKWVEAKTNDGTKLEMEGLVKYNETQDIALLQVKAPESKAPEIKKTKHKAAAASDEEAEAAQVFDLKKPHPLVLAENNPSEGSLVYAIGLPEVNRSTAGWADFGKVQKVASVADVGAAGNSQWLQTDPIITQNNHGGALVGHDGKVVGLLTFPGRTDKGPALSVPVSVIQELLDRPSLDVATTYPNPKGSFAWPAGHAAKIETFPPRRAISTADAVKKRLECATCTGHGYLVTPQFTTNNNNNNNNLGKTTTETDVQSSCDDCGGTGIIINAGIHEIMAGLTRVVLNPETKSNETEILRAKTSVQDAYDRAAVNRLVLANFLDGTAGRLLAEPNANRGEPVVFIAELGPKVKLAEGREIQWVMAYGSNIWTIAYGAEPRTNRSFATGVRAAPAVPSGGRHNAPPAPTVVSSSSHYVLVSGIIEGVTLFDTKKAIYRAPLIRVADIDSLRN